MKSSAKQKQQPLSDKDLDPNFWVEEYGDYLFRFVRMRGFSVEEAEDLVQETFLSAVKAVDSFEGRSSIKTWLTGIIKNKMIDSIRRSKRRPEGSSQEFDEAVLSSKFNSFGVWNTFVQNWAGNPAAALEEKQLYQIFKDCMGKLPDRVRKIFSMRVLDGVETEEICNAFEISTSNLWVILHRARFGIKECVESKWVKGD